MKLLVTFSWSLLSWILTFCIAAKLGTCIEHYKERPFDGQVNDILRIHGYDRDRYYENMMNEKRLLEM